MVQGKGQNATYADFVQPRAAGRLLGLGQRGAHPAVARVRSHRGRYGCGRRLLELRSLVLRQQRPDHHRHLRVQPAGSGLVHGGDHHQGRTRQEGGWYLLHDRRRHHGHDLGGADLPRLRAVRGSDRLRRLHRRSLRFPVHGLPRRLRGVRPVDRRSGGRLSAGSRLPGQFQSARGGELLWQQRHLLPVRQPG